MTNKIEKLMSKIKITWSSKFHGDENFEIADYTWYLNEPFNITAFCEGFTGEDLNYREAIYTQKIWDSFDDWKNLSNFEYDAYDDHIESLAVGDSWRAR
tara:strand:+ start:24 stop:320 length:297 start_codon:yes stop_codon:yes gene_type:complete